MGRSDLRKGLEAPFHTLLLTREGYFCILLDIWVLSYQLCTWAYTKRRTQSTPHNI